MKSNSRFELKYRIPYSEYFKIKNAIAKYMKEDKFTAISENNKYLVRSIYFDNYKLKNYYEKIQGDYSRIKIRIRTYTKTPDENSRLSVELKTRSGELMEKFTTFITYEEYKHFIKTRNFLQKDNKVLDEVARLTYIHNYKPIAVTEYWREGYESRDKRRLRMTFDHDVKFQKTNDLFDQKNIFRKRIKNDIIFEIKYTGRLPYWVSNLIREYGLKRLANSKYCQAIEAHHYDMITAVERKSLLKDFDVFKQREIV